MTKLIAPLILLLSLASTADAQVAQFPRMGATACSPTSSSATTWGRGLLGFYNSSTTTGLSVTCSLPIQGASWTSATAIARAVRVYYHDNHGASGQTVSCTAYVQSQTGTGFSLGTRVSCATPGGCTSSANTYLGSGYLEWSTTSSLQNAAEILVMCTLPPIQSGWAVSSLWSVMAWLDVQ